MSPIDTSRMIPHGGGEEILVDRECAHCGYNLKGLRSNDLCPECGKPASFLDAPTYLSPNKPGKVLRDSGRMLDAPTPYLRLLAMAFRLVAVGGLVMFGSAIAMFFSPVPALAALGLGGALAWTIGAVALSTPRRLGRVRHPINTNTEWPIERAFTVLTQPLWMFAFGCVLAMEIIDDGAQPLRLGAVLSAYAAAIGFIALFTQIANLSYWAGETSLTFRLGKNMWWHVLGVVLTLPLAIGGGLGAYALWAYDRDYPLLWIFVGCAGGAVLIALSTLLTLGSVWRLGSSVRAAMRTADNAELRRQARLQADPACSAPAVFETERATEEKINKPLNPYELEDD